MAIRREYDRVRDAVASDSLNGRVSARGSVLVHSHVSMLAPSPGVHVKPMNPGTLAGVSAGVSKVVVMRLRRTSEPTKGEHHTTPPPQRFELLLLKRMHCWFGRSYTAARKCNALA